MNFNIIAERFKRIDKVTFIASIILLFVTYYIVARIVPLLVYFLDMLGIGNSDIYKYILIVRDYVVIPFILIYYLISIIFGYWDLKFMNILRFKENPKKYEKISSKILNNIDNIVIYTKNNVEAFSIDELENIWNKSSKEAYIKIDNNFLILKDLHIDRDENLNKNDIIIKREEYRYTGKRLLYNKNIISIVIFVTIGAKEEVYVEG